MSNESEIFFGNWCHVDNVNGSSWTESVVIKHKLCRVGSEICCHEFACSNFFVA